MRSDSETGFLVPAAHEVGYAGTATSRRRTVVVAFLLAVIALCGCATIWGRRWRQATSHPAPLNGLVGLDSDADALVNAGRLAWDIIKDSKPVFALAEDFATATPVKDWGAMSGWKIKYTPYFTENWTGAWPWEGVVVAIKWRFRFQYGGEYEGKGQYLTNIVPEVSKCEVTSPYWINVKVNFQRPYNVGTTDYPIAKIDAHIVGSGGYWGWSHTETWTYTFQGDGYSSHRNE